MSLLQYQKKCRKNQSRIASPPSSPSFSSLPPSTTLNSVPSLPSPPLFLFLFLSPYSPLLQHHHLPSLLPNFSPEQTYNASAIMRSEEEPTPTQTRFPPHFLSPLSLLSASFGSLATP
ncbi:hypothetical protein VIGAN_02122100 [Vigna angularis var. angularis]|uniref:Uncharacterized protein n=1 Tax=Vigna angularis var. angularis TaxID=157739 RepID=A0A0S3RCU3_PHAAN|nr:hypothetical protein VIGAN_02122100 [Vigna angularis var. angularis]